MNNALIPFTFENQQVRVITRDGNPWFIAADVCRAIGETNTTDATAKLDPDEKGLEKIQTPGGSQNMVVVNESGLNIIVLRCHDAITPGTPAHRFRKWVTSEVLPSIFKTGQYQHHQAAAQVQVTSRGSITAYPDQSLVNSLFVVQCVTDMLRASEASRIRMLGVVLKEHSMPMALLPAYTEENVTRSLTELLKSSSSPMSTVKVNKILLEMGILEEQTRPGSKGVVHKFKVLTETGLKYGKNLTSPQNERETQPHYYEATFGELMEKVAAMTDIEAKKGVRA